MKKYFINSSNKLEIDKEYANNIFTSLIFHDDFPQNQFLFLFLLVKEMKLGYSKIG